MAIKERLESTTSYFSDEDETVRDFAYGNFDNKEYIYNKEYKLKWYI